MQNVFNIKSLVLALIIIITFLVSGKTSAQGVNDFVISNFEAEYSITNEDLQGLMQVTETIEVNFSGNNRGIIRAIPNTYNSKDLSLKVIDVSKNDKHEPYITYEENDNTVIRIGDANTFITGVQTYKINYSVKNVINFYENYDELYWDVNGTGWIQNFEKVSAIVRSEAILSGVYEPTCFTGFTGTTSQNCTAKREGNKARYETTAPLSSNETLTIIQAFEKGYFEPESWTERNWGLIVASPLFLLQILVVYTSYKKWRKYGKDYDSSVIAPYFGRPKGLSVMQAGYVLENKLLPKHLSAAIIDLSIRRYLSIKEETVNKKVKHTLVLETIPDNYLQPDEKKLIESMFKQLKIGEEYNIEDNKNKLYKTLISLSESINEKMITKGYYETSPRDRHKRILVQLAGMSILAIIGIAFYDFTNMVSVYTTIVMVVFTLIFLSLMTKRSVKGKIIHDHMLGLKLYLDKSENERMKMQDAVAAPLSSNVDQPLRDREFFEKLLPFAIAMNVEKTWSKSFEDLYTEPPEWYQGKWSTFSTATLMSGVNNTVKSSGQSFQPPSSSGSSGYSGGGGFSGGGGGGGGGGGW
jgi:uncharacterized membrane protein YgcG